MYLIARRLLEFYMNRKFKVVFHNKEKIPPKKISKKGGFIIACNHQFYWDPPLVAAYITGKYSFMAKAELFNKKKPFFTWLIRRCGAFPVTRGADSEKAIQEALNTIKKGRIFVIFPEGTRSKDGVIGRGKSGVAMIAAMAAAPILPVCLMYGLNGEKKRVDYAVGDMIPAEELAIGSDDRRGLKRVSERVMGAVKELQQQILDSVGAVISHSQK
ncbi:MAG: 1-acyl-sn-glycerol-3-phosphate acyltransferase [Oscillospiraceae bacterium]|jgi:1-acyl-sn-glycerol-3-phosphate acyltransferase|nr:1-acyl-sn-glycerol-3-phosphate acyltransferase [Oscillospiraceae bacterium]